MRNHVLTGVIYLSSVAAVVAETPLAVDNHTVGIGLLGLALAVIAFFLKRVLDRTERKLDSVGNELTVALRQVAVLEEWRSAHDKFAEDRTESIRDLEARLRELEQR